MACRASSGDAASSREAADRSREAIARILARACAIVFSSIAFEEFGYRTDFPHDPLPNRTFAVQSRIPDFVPLWGSLLGGIWWITHRREEVAKTEGKDATTKGGAK